ncbi:MAG: InlB B-repeat-containing protein, partial [Alphaproteobacteria bacterium]
EYTFSETNNQGIESCPTGFTLSAAGSSAQTDCYRTCTTNDVAHSATVSGGFYYGNNNQCVPESCVTGYHVFAGITNPFTGKESIEGTNCGCQNDRRGSYGADSYNTDTYNITEDQSWATEFSYGVVRGIASCNDTAGNHNDYRYDNDSSNWSRPGDTFTQDSTGRYCWCKITGYTPTGGTLQSLVSSWVFYSDREDADKCAGGCADACANDLLDDVYFRPALLGSASASEPPACIANTINVTWNPLNGLEPTTNQCTYDGAITLPTAPEKTGYTFKGWKLVTGSSN